MKGMRLVGICRNLRDMTSQNFPASLINHTGCIPAAEQIVVVTYFGRSGEIRALNDTCRETENSVGTERTKSTCTALSFDIYKLTVWHFTFSTRFMHQLINFLVLSPQLVYRQGCVGSEIQYRPIHKILNTLSIFYKRHREILTSCVS